MQRDSWENPADPRAQVGPPAWASWTGQEGSFGGQQDWGPLPSEQQQFHDVEDDGGSSRASSPSKSPLLQSARLLDQIDQPLLRQPLGRSFRASHQSGSDAGEQPRPPMQFGAQQQQQRPSSPLASRAQMDRWHQDTQHWQQDSRAADRAAAAAAAAARVPPPNRRTLFAQQAAYQQQQQQQQQQSESTRSDGGSRQNAYGMPMASDPMTFQQPAGFDRDGVPNMGDVTDGERQWQIPAMRGNTPSAGQPRASPAPSVSGRRGPSDKMPGAVVKLGRRQAWLKYLAYEGCWQVCLDNLLNSAGPEAREFLQDGCLLLRTGLGLESLLLSSILSDTGLAGGSAETAIYWDDKEDGPLAAVELETKMVQQPQPALPPPVAPKPPPLQPVMQPPAPPRPQVPAAMPLGSGGSASSGSSRGERQGPALEVTVVRVVGCDALNPASTKQYYLAMYPSSKTADSGGAWTLVSTDGSTHSQEPIELNPIMRQETLAVELFEEDVPLAMGTIQIAELHKLATQQDVFAEESHSPGFLKSLFPCLRSKGSHQSRMAWIKLVDNSGRTCGHSVLSARMVSSLGGEMGFLGPRNGRENLVIEEIGTMNQEYQTLRQKAQQQYPPQQQQQPSYQQQQQLYQQQQEQLYQQQYAQQQQRQQQQQQLAQPPPREIATTVAMVRVDPAAAKQGNSVGGYMHVTAQQVYDELLAAALKSQGCGPRRLELFGSWKWLLQEFARVYGVRHNYTTLSYLKWVVRPENATITADCFTVLLREVGPLKQAQHDKQLSSGELGVLDQVAQRIEELLTQCFENYFMLSEDAANGMMEGALSIRGQIPPVLQPAVALFAHLRDGMTPADQSWLAERFSVAAKKRFHGLLTATALQNPGVSPHLGAGGHDRRAAVDSPSAINAYSSVEELCKAIMNELRADDLIKEAKVLPPFINLPELTSVEYIKGIIKHLRHVLRDHPPPAPTEPAVRLVEAVGKLQDFVYRHAYEQATALLNSKEIFGKFVYEWIHNSYVLLTQRCRALESAAPAVAGWQDFGMEGKQRVAPLVEEMLSAIEGEMGRYERIITYWPIYGPDLEKCVTGALRESTMAVSRQCGLVNTKENGNGQMVMARAGTSPAPRGGRTGWAWVQPQHDRIAVPATFQGVPVCLQQGINPNQALLMNSLRRLLAVSPQMEHRLSRWCGGILVQSQTSLQPSTVGVDRIARDAPNLGAQFAQMVKELRSEYFAAITLCAEKLALTLAGAVPTSVIMVLRTEGLTAQGPRIQHKLVGVMEELEKLLQWLSSTLDNRVFVALTRGLWDLASKDVLQYAEDLQEGHGQHGAWRGRQNASVAIKVLDQFFKGALTASMGNDLQNKDLALPAHSDRAHKLLAENMTSVNMSYDVY